MALLEFKNLFLEELKEIYSIEKQIAKALPELIASCETKKLAEVLTDHLKGTKEQIARLEKAFDSLEVSQTSSKKSEIMDLLLKECQKVTDRYPRSCMRDADLILRLQCIQHYEMAVYGTLRTFARVINQKESAQLFQKSLDEEKRLDKELSKIAEGGLFAEGVNQKASKKAA